MTSFTQTFGGQNISPAQLNYVGLGLTGNVQLSWAFETGASLVYGAHKTNIVTTTGAHAITLADATLVSNGQDIVFINDTASTITIKSYGGTTIGTVASGLSWMFYLKSNATQAGSWGSFQLGAGTSSATAGALAGLGIVAITTTLNQSAPVTETAVGVTLAAADRAQVIVNTGGVVTFALTAAATLGNNWFALVRNAGTGILTIDPSGAETIDDAATKTLAPTESCFVVCDGGEFYTVGYGRALSSTASASSIAVTGTGDYTLTAAESAAIVQDYVGVLSGNRTALYGTTPGEWAVYNNTSGSFTLTLKAGSGDTGIVIQQGQYAVARSDGTTMSFATVSSGSQTFTTSGTFTWPVCEGAIAYLLAPGGGGGRGGAGASSGSGAGGGERKKILIVPPPAAGTATTVTINAPGAGASANNTSGAAGGTVVFGLYGTATGGLAGGVGSGTQGAGGGGASGVVNTSTSGDLGAFTNIAGGVGLSAEYGGGSGGSGSAGVGNGAAGGSSVFGGPGGGGGGGNAPNAGGAGGRSGSRPAGGGAAGGGAGGASGSVGAAGAAGTLGLAGAGGGGGGGGTDAGGAGGTGGYPGAGGGGGGYGLTTTGDGGTGGAGQLIITWW